MLALTLQDKNIKTKRAPNLNLWTKHCLDLLNLTMILLTYSLGTINKKNESNVFIDNKV